jgi:hypothetical protein
MTLNHWKDDMLPKFGELLVRHLHLVERVPLVLWHEPFPKHI